jgi:hypothetical protein
VCRDSFKIHPSRRRRRTDPERISITQPGSIFSVLMSMQIETFIYLPPCDSPREKNTHTLKCHLKMNSKSHKQVEKRVRERERKEVSPNTTALHNITRMCAGETLIIIIKEKN